MTHLHVGRSCFTRVGQGPGPGAVVHGRPPVPVVVEAGEGEAGVGLEAGDLRLVHHEPVRLVQALEVERITRYDCRVGQRGEALEDRRHEFQFNFPVFPLLCHILQAIWDRL